MLLQKKWDNAHKFQRLEGKIMFYKSTEGSTWKGILSTIVRFYPLNVNRFIGHGKYPSGFEMPKQP